MQKSIEFTKDLQNMSDLSSSKTHATGQESNDVCSLANTRQNKRAISAVWMIPGDQNRSYQLYIPKDSSMSMSAYVAYLPFIPAQA